MSAVITNAVRKQLQTLARSSGRTFQEISLYYAIERFLYRLSVSNHREKFILKGGLLLRTWDAPMSRATKDIDLLGFASNDLGEIENIVREICDPKLPARTCNRRKIP
jgi:predicted nucleotidyltransferase component of viral defense system